MTRTDKADQQVHSTHETQAVQPVIPLRIITLTDIKTAFDAQTLISADLVEAYTLRAHEIDSTFCSIIVLSPSAISHAHALDAERLLHGCRGPLHGIPILLKDNIPTLDDTDTCAGSLALVGARPGREASVVTALRRAGAVLMGKTNMAELSGFRSTSGCSGWSGRGGQTYGIFVEGQKCSGSSGGSAVAVGLGLCCAALGTETCWTIVNPAEKSGVVGFKPTRDLFSSEGIIGASERQDTVGLLTRSVQDAALVAIGIVLETDHHTQDMKLLITHKFGQVCTSLDLRGIRIGIPSGFKELDNLAPIKSTRFAEVLTTLERAGATIVHNVHITGAKAYESLPIESRNIILDTDMKLAITTYLSSLSTNPNNIHNLEDLINFTKRCKGEKYPQRNVEVLERAQATHPEGALYKAMLAKDAYFTGEGGIAGALCRYRYDVLLSPMMLPTLQIFAAKAGLPVLSVPVGVFPEGTSVVRDGKNGLMEVAPGIPFSAFVYGRATEDDVVLKVGYVLEQLAGVGGMLRPFLEARVEIGDV